MNAPQEARSPAVAGVQGPDSHGTSPPFDMNPAESVASLERALRTLKAIRQRYEVGCSAHRDARFYGVQVVVDRSDVAWISATIEALERAVPVAGTEPLPTAPLIGKHE